MKGVSYVVHHNSRNSKVQSKEYGLGICNLRQKTQVGGEETKGWKNLKYFSKNRVVT